MVYRVLQAHNRHATRGGADAVMDQDRRILESAGHVVEQFVTEAVTAGDPKTAVRAVWNLETVRDLKARVRLFGPDVVHVHTPFPLMSPTVFRAAHSLGVPTVATVHSFRFTCIAGTLRRDGHLCHDCVGRRVKLPAVRHRCYHDSAAPSLALASSLTLHHAIGTFRRHVDRFLTMTPFARAILVRDGMPAERVAVKPNCVPDPGPLPHVLRRPRRVLFAGRLVEEKGVTTLLDAWRHTDRRGYELRLCGDGPLKDLVDRTARSDPSVRSLGWLSGADLASERAEARLTVVPSEWYEAGPPLVMLDSLADATPVVSSELENISAGVVRAGAGRTFRTGDSSDLAAVLSAALAAEEELADMSARARALYESEHTPERALELLESTYAHVTADR